jgi:ubiquitin-conjugating enzyme E2 Z
MNDALKRIIIDIKDVQKSPIDNIHYVPNEENIFNGYALIIGPPNTPYEYGNFLFEFHFSEKYPYEPPKVVYKSNDGATRFNPNLYRSGKVCLSILNTWSGEQWSACQTLRSVLLTLQMTLNEMPLVNEPGVDEKLHMGSILKYNKMVHFKTLEFTILYYMKNIDKIPIQDPEIIGKMKEFYEINKTDILKSALELKINLKTEMLYTQMYDMKMTLNYEDLYNRLNTFINKN